MRAQRSMIETPYRMVIEASTYRASVALLCGAQTVGDADVAMKGEREERLMPAVAELLDGAQLGVSDLGGVIVGAGPGSFTSLRIAGAIAKGMCAGARIPMFAVSSLALMAGGITGLEPGRYLTALDALRGEWYTALARVDDTGVADLEPVTLVRATALSEYAQDREATLIAPADGAHMAHPVARGIARCLRLVQAVDMDTWEPEYGRLPAAESKRLGVG